MTDRYADFQTGFDAPATHGFPIVPGDTDLTETTRAIYVGLGGDIVATLASGATVSFRNVATSSVLPLRVKRITALGTTAANLVGLV